MTSGKAARRRVMAPARVRVVVRRWQGVLRSPRGARQAADCQPQAKRPRKATSRRPITVRLEVVLPRRGCGRHPAGPGRRGGVYWRRGSETPQREGCGDEDQVGGRVAADGSGRRGFPGGLSLQVAGNSRFARTVSVSARPTANWAQDRNSWDPGKRFRIDVRGPRNARPASVGPAPDLTVVAADEDAGRRGPAPSDARNRVPATPPIQ